MVEGQTTTEGPGTAARRGAASGAAALVRHPRLIDDPA